MNKVAGLIIIVVCLCLTTCMRLDSFLFNPNSAGSIKEYKLEKYDGELQFSILDSSFGIDSSRVRHVIYKSGDNNELNIHAFLVEPPTGFNPLLTNTIVYCHGNKDHIDYYWPRVQLLAATGHRVFIMDYRGYGLSTGEPTEAGMYQDVRQGLQWLIDNVGLTDSSFVMYGYSLGTAPATELTSYWTQNPGRLKPKMLILESPYASSEMLVQDGSQLALPGSYLVDLKIDNAEEIKNVDIPFLWIHGIEDDFLEMKIHGEVVYKNYNGPQGYAKRVAGATHSNVPLVIGFVTYVTGLKTFISGGAPFGLAP